MVKALKRFIVAFGSAVPVTVNGSCGCLELLLGLVITGGLGNELIFPVK